MALSVENKVVYLRCAIKVALWSGDTEPTAYSAPINFTKLELTSPEQEKEELISNISDNFGVALDSQNKPTAAATITAEFSTMPPELLALVLGADVSEQSQTGATVTDSLITTQLNKWVDLPDRHLASFATLETSTDALIAASKYEIDLTLGQIMATHADAVGVGMKATYATASRVWEEYLAGQAKTSYVKLIGRATNMSTGKTGIITVPKASLAPSGSVDAVAGGYFSGTLSGSLIAPPGYSSPWIFTNTTA